VTCQRPVVSAEPTTLSRKRLPYLVLAIGILAVSSSAILITFARAQGVPAVAIAAWRLTLASLLLAPIILTRGPAEWRQLSRLDLALAVLSGIFLAFHFAFWISSLDYTSVMSSIVLVNTNPFFVGLASVFLFQESLRRWTVVGILIAAVGGALVGLTDMGQGSSQSLQGDALALAGAVAVSGYLLIGRRLRRQLSLFAYIGLVYSTAAVVLLALAALMGTPLLNYSPLGYLLIILLAVGPQLIGHSSYNWALKYVSATFVTVAILAEPIGATLLAIPLLDQIPPPIKIVGGALILAGIYLAARAETRTELSETADAVAET
jgi:drug/metabolite transporter (DMT)-like permease